MTKIKVMVIDDDELDRYIVTRTLRKFEVFGKIVELSDGQEAADVFHSPEFIEEWGPPPPTLILLDINMPRMTGFEFLDHLAQLDDHLAAHWTGCVILMLTSSNHAEDKQQAENCSYVKGYVNKPLSAEKVQAILDENYSTLDSNPS